jgi:hypothetical protein
MPYIFGLQHPTSCPSRRNIIRKYDGYGQDHPNPQHVTWSLSSPDFLPCRELPADEIKHESVGVDTLIFAICIRPFTLDPDGEGYDGRPHGHRQDTSTSRHVAWSLYMSPVLPLDRKLEARQRRQIFSVDTPLLTICIYNLRHPASGKQRDSCQHDGNGKDHPLVVWALDLISRHGRRQQ